METHRYYCVAPRVRAALDEEDTLTALPNRTRRAMVALLQRRDEMLNQFPSFVEDDGNLYIDRDAYLFLLNPRAEEQVLQPTVRARVQP